MAPVVRQSWAPRGQTPILYQGGRFREKVSSIAAISISPRRRRVGLYFSLGANLNVEAHWIVGFLRDLARHIRNPIILVWDRLPSHRGAVVSHFLARQARIRVELLPAYAPELNPVEGIWSYLKLNPLANLAALDASELVRLVGRQARWLTRRKDLLRSFIRATGLFLRL